MKEEREGRRGLSRNVAEEAFCLKSTPGEKDNRINMVTGV